MDVWDYVVICFGYIDGSKDQTRIIYGSRQGELHISLSHQ
jgi:hypothetical protein